MYDSFSREGLGQCIQWPPSVARPGGKRGKNPLVKPLVGGFFCSADFIFIVFDGGCGVSWFND